MKLLITGATGFVGKNLVYKLLENNHRVVVNLHSSTNLFGSKVETIRLMEGTVEDDINNLNSLNIDGIVHLASLYITSHKTEDVSTLLQTNILFSSYLLELACKLNVSWFVNTGTFWQHYKDSPYDPVNLYAASKQAFEAIAQYYINTNQIKFVTLKLSDTYGLGDPRPKILNLLDRISKSGELLYMSPGEQLIDISHISDVINAFILLIEKLFNCSKEIENGDSFAVKANKRYSLKELVKIFKEVSSREVLIKFGGKPYRDREVMEPWNTGTVVPGWKPMVSIEEGIKQLIEK